MPDSMSTLEETGTRITDVRDNTDIHDNTEVTEDAAPLTEGDLLEDSLVEEVSIDGMCGVY